MNHYSMWILIAVFLGTSGCATTNARQAEYTDYEASASQVKAAGPILEQMDELGMLNSMQYIDKNEDGEPIPRGIAICGRYNCMCIGSRHFRSSCRKLHMKIVRDRS